MAEETLGKHKGVCDNQALLIQKLVRQEAVITVWNMPDIELQKVQYKYPLEWIVPRKRHARYHGCNGHH